MTDFIQSATTWGPHAALAGAVVFGLGWVWVRRVGDPARRRALAAWVVRGGLVAAVLCVFPAWLLIPAPWRTAPQVVPEELPDRPLPLEASRPLPPAVALAEERDIEWVVVRAPVWVEEVRDVVAVPGERGGVSPPVVEAETPAAAPPLAASGSATGGLTPPARPEVGVAPLLLGAYAVGAAVAGAPLLLGAVALVRLRRSGRPAPAGVQAVFDDLAAGCRATLLVSDRVASPLCFGLFRPVVLLPRELAKTATEAELRWVFAHELDHLKRGDPWAGWWVAAARAVYFFVPWFWRVRRELVLAQEHLADAAAVAAGGRGEDYAAFLVRLSGGSSGRRHPVGAAGVRANKSDLFWRVTMILKPKDESPARATRRWSAVAAAGVLGTAVLLSGVGFANPLQDEKKVEKKAEKAPPADLPKDESKPKDDILTGPPPQLELLRKAVEAAAKKGENVDDIRAQLDELEKALAGKKWVKPKPVPLPVDPPPVPLPPGRGVPNFQPPPVVFGGDAFGGFGNFNVFPLGGGLDPEALKKAQDVLQKGMEALRANPNDREAFDKAMQEYRKILGDGFGGGVVVGPGARLLQPALPGIPGERVVVGGRGGEGRLGVRVEKVPAVLVEQLGMEAGKGLVVSEVVRGSAAEKAGIKANDIILEFAGKPVGDDVNEFVRTVGGVKKDEKVDLTVLRKGKKEAVKGVELPEAIAPARPGAAEGALRPRFERPERAGRIEPIRPVPALPGLGGEGSSSMSVSISNGDFTIQAEQNGVKYTIAGALEGGKAVPSKITVVDGDKKTEAESVEKLPAEYRDRVTKMLGSVRGGR